MLFKKFLQNIANFGMNKMSYVNELHFANDQVRNRLKVF